MALQQETTRCKASAEVFGKKGGNIFGEKASVVKAKAVRAVGAAGDALQGGVVQLAGQPPGPDLKSEAANTEQLMDVSLDDLHSKAMKLERKGWGKKQKEERRAAKVVADWLATQSDLKAAGLILS